MADDTDSVILNKLNKLAIARKYDELETEWLQAVESDSLHSDAAVTILGILAGHKQLDKADTLAWCMITEYRQKRGDQTALEVVRLLAKHLGGGPSIREEAGSLYTACYQDCQQLETLLGMTVLRDETPFANALNQIDKLLEIPVGSYVRDCNVSAPGKVVSIDPERSALFVQRNDNEYRYQGDAIDRLELLDDDHYQALQAFDPQRLQEIASENAERFVIQILRDHGPIMKFREIKDEICQAITAKKWTSWWKAAKPKLSQSPMIDMTDSTQPTFELRKRPIGHAQVFSSRFNEADLLDDRFATVLDYLDQIDDGVDSDQPALAAFAAHMCRYAKSAEHLCHRLTALAVHSELVKRTEEDLPQAETKISDIIAADAENDPAMFMMNVCNDRIAKLTLSYLADELGDGYLAFLSDVMPGCPTAICDWIASQIIASDNVHLLVLPAENITASPDRYIRATIWLWKAVCVQKIPEVVKYVDGIGALAAILSATHTLKRNSPFEDTAYAKRISQQMRSSLSAKKFGVLRDVLKHANRERAAAINESLQRNAGLTDMLRTDMQAAFQTTFADKFAEEIPIWKEDALYSTRESLDVQRAALKHLMTVELPAISKRIGEAAAYGDLRENAEYTSAREERERQGERAAMLRDQLTKGRIIEPGSIGTESVTIGSTIKIINVETNETKSMTFLGPWDAAPDEHIYSYLAPIAQAFMGKKIDDTAQHLSGTWKVTEIAAAI